MKPLFFFVFCILPGIKASSQNNDSIIQMLYTSDAHYGITRSEFRGQKDAAASVVNAAMIESMNRLPGTMLPADHGIKELQQVAGIDYLIQTGDIANRMEEPVQSAAQSWREFYRSYVQELTVKDAAGNPVRLLLLAGNHDISNAIGHYKKMNPVTDPSVMVNVYNLMMQPAIPLTAQTYDYRRNPIHYSFNKAGIHFMFINLWPDSTERVWMSEDLDTVAETMPVLVFTHDQPECDAKHFTNPNMSHDINKVAKFENLLTELYKDSTEMTKGEAATNLEQKGWVAFIKKHPNIKAYFHGNANCNQYYTYKGPEQDITLPVFRVDSPMKGSVSSKDETKLSYQLITIDTRKKLMTVRECLWNAGKQASPVVWGASATIPL